MYLLSLLLLVVLLGCRRGGRGSLRCLGLPQHSRGFGPGRETSPNQGSRVLIIPARFGEIHQCFSIFLGIFTDLQQSSGISRNTDKTL